MKTTAYHVMDQSGHKIGVEWEKFQITGAEWSRTGISPTLAAISDCY